MAFPWMQTNVFTLTFISMSHTIDVPALEAALQLLNRGKGCGRLARERMQLLSFCLGGKQKINKLKPRKHFPHSVCCHNAHHIPANQRP